MSESRFQV